MAKRWTKGPWRLGRIRATDRGGQRITIDAPLHEAFAEVVWRMTDDTRSLQQEANATLVAAAPELYDALEGIVNAYLANEPVNASFTVAKALIKRLEE